MLFANNKACFSPAIHAAYRRAWVNNGGKMANTESGFYDAQFFFCDGLGDPWLSNLSSRRLIVRHPAWIAQCISEKFIMPVAQFTLDSRFDPQAIEITRIASDELMEAYAASPKSPPEEPGNAVKTPEVSKKRKSTRKRSLVEDSFERPRMVKRARIYAPEDPPRTPSRTRLKSATPVRKSSPVEESVVRSPSPSPHSDILQQTPRGENTSHSNLPRETIVDDRLTYWDGLFAPKETDSVLTLRIENILRAPRVQGGLFCGRKEFMGKLFHARVNHETPKNRRKSERLSPDQNSILRMAKSFPMAACFLDLENIANSCLLPAVVDAQYRKFSFI